MRNKINQKVVIFIGPPGSGKGLQANLVAEKFNLYHIETSELLERCFSAVSYTHLTLPTN